MKNVVQATEKFIATYGAGEHTAKEIFLFGKSESAKGLYPAMVKNATRGTKARGTYLVDAALVAKLSAMADARGGREAEMNAKREAIAKERTEAKAKREAANALKAKEKLERNEAKAKAKAAKDAAKQTTVKASTVRAAKAKVKKDDKLADATESASAIVPVAKLQELGFKEINQAQASELYGAGVSVLMNDSDLDVTMASPPIASDFVLKSETMRFYAKQ